MIFGDRFFAPLGFVEPISYNYGSPGVFLESSWVFPAVSRTSLGPFWSQWTVLNDSMISGASFDPKQTVTDHNSNEAVELFQGFLATQHHPKHFINKILCFWSCLDVSLAVFIVLTAPGRTIKFLVDQQPLVDPRSPVPPRETLQLWEYPSNIQRNIFLFTIEKLSTCNHDCLWMVCWFIKRGKFEIRKSADPVSKRGFPSLSRREPPWVAWFRNVPTCYFHHWNETNTLAWFLRQGPVGVVESGGMVFSGALLVLKPHGIIPYPLSDTHKAPE